MPLFLQELLVEPGQNSELLTLYKVGSKNNSNSHMDRVWSEFPQRKVANTFYSSKKLLVGKHSFQPKCPWGSCNKLPAVAT